MTNEELIEKLTDLVLRSESRIDATNKMISKLVDLYERQFDHLQKSKINEEDAQRELRHLLDRAIDITDNLSKAPATQVNILQQ